MIDVQEINRKFILDKAVKILVEMETKEIIKFIKDNSESKEEN